MNIIKYITAFFLFLGCYPAFSQNIEWSNSDILSYSYSKNEDYFLIFLISPNDYFCHRLLININSNSELVNFVNKNFVPIQIDINNFNQTIILEEEVYHSKPDIAYGLSPQDINLLSKADEIDEDIVLLCRGFVDHYYIYSLDFLIAAENYIDFENVIYWRKTIENISIKETEKSKSDFINRYFNLSSGIPQILVLNKKKEIIFNLNGYHNPILLLNDLTQIIN